jgi:hypothetical protein
VPCSNGVLVRGRLVTVTKFRPGTQLRILGMRYCSDRVCLDVEDAEDDRWSMSIPLVGVGLVNPGVTSPIPLKPREEGHAHTFWALSSLKDLLQTGIRRSASRRRGVITIEFAEYNSAIGAKLGIVETVAAPSRPTKYSTPKYSVYSSDPAQTTGALDGILGDGWDLILDDAVVIFQITFKVAGSRYYKCIKASIGTAHSQGDPFDPTDYREIARNCVQHELHAPIPDDEDEEDL